MPNEVSLSRWKTVFSLADELYALRPWKTMYDNDRFGVVDPETGERLYCVVLGANKEVYGINLFLGDRGLSGLMSMSNDPEAMMRILNIIWLHFERPDEVYPELLSVEKKIGLNYKNEQRWPDVMRMRPNYYPSLVEAEDVDLLIRVLPGVIEMLKRYRDCPEKLDHSGKWSFCELKSGKWAESAFDPYRKKRQRKETAPESGNIVRLNSAVHLSEWSKRKDAVWQLSMTIGVKPLHDEKTGRNFVPRILVGADPVGHRVLGFEMAPPDIESPMLTILKNLAEKHGYLPSAIEVDRQEYMNELEPVCEENGIKLKLNKNMEEMNEIIDGMLQALEKKGQASNARHGKTLHKKTKRIRPQLDTSDGRAIVEYPKTASQYISDSYEVFELMDSGRDDEAYDLAVEICDHIDGAFDLLVFLAEESFSRGLDERGAGYAKRAMEDLTDLISSIPSNTLLEWGFVENRPMLRFMYHLGIVTMNAKDYESAVNYFDDMIRLNPNDNQGVRDVLPEVLLELKNYQAVLKLSKNFPDDTMCGLLYALPLALLGLGRKEEALKKLKKACKIKPLVVKELLKTKHKRPVSKMEGYITVGGEDEAYDYYSRYGKFWKKIPGALELLEECAGK